MTGKPNSKPTVILGGSGKTGRRVAERLAALGLPVRPASRSTIPRFDWNDPETWSAALDGAGALFIAYQPDLAVPGAVNAVRQITVMALRAGVRRMVLLSGRGEEEAQRAEAVFQACGADWTIVRTSWFMQNFSEAFMADALRAGNLMLPAGAVREPFIDVEDIADVVTAALTDPRHIGQLYELTGPRLLNFAEAVGEIAAVSGRPLHYTQISEEDFTAGMRSGNAPEEMISLLNYLFTTVLDGRNAQIADGVERALGRPPRDFADYARRAAGQAGWGEAA